MNVAVTITFAIFYISIQDVLPYQTEHMQNPSFSMLKVKICDHYLVENSVASTSGAGITKHTDGTSHCLLLAFVICQRVQQFSLFFKRTDMVIHLFLSTCLICLVCLSVQGSH